LRYRTRQGQRLWKKKGGVGETLVRFEVEKEKRKTRSREQWGNGCKKFFPGWEYLQAKKGPKAFQTTKAGKTGKTGRKGRDYIKRKGTF